MRILEINDPHVTGRSPQGRVDVYPNAIKDKLIEVGDIANKASIDLILCSGDVFHTSIVAINYSSEIAKIIKSWNKPVYVVPGNHDIDGYSISTLSNTMLGMFASTGVVRLLTRDNPLILNFGSKKLVIEGQEYCVDIDKDPTNYNKKVNGDFNILVAHGMLQPKPILNSIDHVVIDQIPNPADITFVGHDHKGFGVIKDSNNNVFANIGSIGRTDKSDTHTPSVLITEINLDEHNDFKYSLGVVELTSAKKHDEVFDTTTTVQQNYKNNFASFVSTIQSSNISAKKDRTEYINELVQDGTITQEIGETCNEYINNAKQHLNTNNITQYTKISQEIYISKITLKNFLSHKDTTIEFDKGFNVIVGGNSSGKTSILRAIQWVLYDTPSGTNFFRTGAKECDVYIEFSNGTWISKRKTKSTAEYKVCSDGANVKSYKGFGNKLPIDILNCHQMPLVNLYKDKMSCLNYGSQLDGLFLVDKTQSEKAEALGKITGADIIDTAIDDVSKEVKSLSKDINDLTKKKTSLKEEFGELTLEKAKAQVLHDTLEKNIDLIEKYNKVIDSIKRYQDNSKIVSDNTKELDVLQNKLNLSTTAYHKTNNLILAINKVIPYIKATECISKASCELKVVEDRLNKCSNSIDDTISSSLVKNIIKYYSSSDISVSKLKERTIVNGFIKELEKTVDVNYDNAIKSMMKYLNIQSDIVIREAELSAGLKTLEMPKDNYSKAVELLLKHKDISDKVSFIEANMTAIDKKEQESNKELDKTNNEINNIKKELHDNGVCPTCNRKLDDKAIEYMIANGGN